ncbi:MAG: SdrD B-like domain-containing protein [Pirellulaceae bacterium]
MASFIGRLLARFTKQKQVSRRARRAKNRPLRLEPMEMRRLLAGDIGSIAGNLYVDLTDNGIDPADGAVVGTAVHLYRDGGVGGFESGGGVAGGDDTLIGTVNSDANGDYRFDNLTAGTYFVEQAVAAAFLQRTGESPKTVVISEAQSAGVQTTNIDTHDTTAQVVTAAQGQTVGNTINTAAGEVIGDERDIRIVNTGLVGAGDLEATVNSVAIPGVMVINTDSGAQGRVIVTYDGDDDDDDTINFNPLTSLNADLTATNGEAFHFLATSQAGNQLTVNVYTTATDFSSRTVDLPVTGSLLTFENLIIDFADFVADPGGTGADFTNVAAIRMELTIAETADARIDFSQVVAPFVSTQDFQNLNPMSVGNLVFNDQNNNGLFDTGETGIPGVDVQLYQDDGNGTFDDDTNIDALIGTATTDVGGNYVFNNLFPGDYIAVIRQSEFATAADPLFGFLTSTGNDPAPDPDINVSDNDDNGALVAGVGVVTGVITLASGTEPTNDGDTDTNSNLTLDFGFAPQIDLEVIKTVDAQAKIAGNQVTYTLQISNNGDATANDVLVVDDLPDFLTIDSVTATGGGVVAQTANANGEIEVTYTNLAAQQTETITIVATIPAAQAAATGVVNTATISGSGVETNPNNNTSTANIDITRQAVLALTKSDTPDPNTVGSQLTYTILVTNNGPSTATNVVVTDTLPAGLTFDTVTTTAGTASEAAGVITATIPTLAVGASETVTVVTTIQATFAGTTIANTAGADADEAAPVTANADTTINPQVDLVITKSDRTDPTSRGNQLVYDLAVTNNGPSGATNVEVVDTLPVGVTFVSATGGTVTPPVGASRDVLIAIGAMASGATVNLTITVDVEDAAANSITNTAIVRSTETLAGFESTPADNTTTEPTAIQSEIDLAIDKRDLTDPVKPGESFTYELVVTNNGPSAATSVVVTDNLPDGIQVNSATSTVGTVTIPASAQDTTAANNDDLTVAIPTLANGATATVTINATVLPGTRGTNNVLTNVSSVATTDTNFIETVTTNNTDSEDTTLNPEIDLRISKVDSVDPITPGSSLTYTIVVTNDGPSTATNVNLSDTLPAGVTFTSVSSTQGTATQANGVVTAALGSLAPAASATVTLIVGVNTTATGDITNTATVSGTETEVTTTNNSATATTTVTPRVDLVITKSDSLDPVAAGGTLTYTLTVTNNGPSAATNVAVTDNLPTGLTFVSGTSSVGTLTNNGNNVSVAIPTLASGASATITINANVAGTQTTGFTNTASVTSTETDLVPANNTTSEPTAIAVPTSISGVVYVDANGNNVRDTGEEGIGGVTFALSGTDVLGNVINRTATSSDTGAYTFTNLLPGTYTVTQSQPANFEGEGVNIGTGATGTAGTNAVTINLANDPAVAFDFPEVQAAFSKRMFMNKPQ